MKRTKKQFIKGITILCAMVLMFSVLAGCGLPVNTPTQGTTESGDANDVKVEEPIKMSIMNIFFDPEPPKKNSPVLKAIEEFTNYELDITWVPSSAYADKVNVTLASNELPNVILVTENKNPNIVNAVRAGMFWEVGPYLKDYNNLSNDLSDIVFNNISVDGKIFALYRARAISRSGYVVRTDWLDNLGLEEPKTVDDFYNMLKAFAENDPDQNGKKDTFGLASGMPEYDYIITALGGPNKWGLMDGQLKPSFMFPENMEALKFFKKLYDEGLMNQDFPIVTTTQKDTFFVQGKAGAFIAVADDAVHPRYTEIFNLFPEAKIAPGSSLEGPAGKKIPAGTGYNGIFMFPKPSVKTEEDLKNYLAFFEKLGEVEMLNLLEWGMEDEHYSMVNGVPERQTAEQQEKFSREVNPFRQIMVFEYDKAMKGNLTPTQVEVQKYYDDNRPNVVANLVEPYISNTQSEKGGELDQIISDARIKFILGEIDEAGFNQEVERWKKNGGDEIIKEFNDEYQKAQ